MFYGNTFINIPFSNNIVDSAAFYDIQDAKMVYELVNSIRNKISD